MRIAYFLILITVVINMILFIIGNIFNVNVYKTYGVQIYNWFWHFLLLVLAVYVAICIGSFIN